MGLRRCSWGQALLWDGPAASAAPGLRPACHPPLAHPRPRATRRPDLAVCVLSLPLSQLAAHCLESAETCSGFVYKAAGVFNTGGDRGVGMFSNAPIANATQAIIYNPTAVFYLRDAPPAGGSSPALSAGAIAGIAVGATAAALAVLAAALLLIRRQRRRRQTGPCGAPSPKAADALAKAMEEGAADSPGSAPSDSAAQPSCRSDATAAAAAASTPAAPPCTAAAYRAAVLPTAVLASVANECARVAMSPFASLAVGAPFSTGRLRRAGSADSCSATSVLAALRQQQLAPAGGPPVAWRRSAPAEARLGDEWMGEGPVRLTAPARLWTPADGAPSPAWHSSTPAGQLQDSCGQPSAGSPSSSPRSSAAEGGLTPVRLSRGQSSHRQCSGELSELMQLVAAQDTAAQQEAAPQEEGPQLSGLGAALPATLRAWVVDPADVCLLRWPNGSLQVLGSGARCARHAGGLRDSPALPTACLCLLASLA